MSDRYRLRGHVRLQLIRELALGVRSERELGAMFNVSGPAIHQFKVSNTEAIESARLDIENEFSALWIANKSARLAELQEDVEYINEALDQMALTTRPRLYAAKHAALRQAAEELGQLAAKSVNVGTTVRYEITGVDMDQLR